MIARSEKDRRGDDEYDLLSAVKESYENHFTSLFAAGHVHNKKHVETTTGFAGYTGIMAKFLALNSPTKQNGRGLTLYPDYQQVLDRQTPCC